MTTQEILRIINLILVITGIVVWIYYGKKYKQVWAKAPLTWLINVGAFYIYLLSVINNVTPEIARVINTWSTALHAHAGILLITAALIMISHRERKNGKL